MKINNLVNHATSFFFPNTCLVCKKFIPGFNNKHSNISYNPVICDSCEKEIEFIKDQLYCKKCGKVLPYGGMYCYQCLKRKRPYHFEFIRAACVYKDTIKKCIHLFKYSGKDYLNEILGNIFISNFNNDVELLESNLIIPVPLHWWKKIKRGYNQTELLSNKISYYFNKQLLINVLYRNKYTKPQFNLEKEERVLNIKDAFAVKRADLIEDKIITLIDDISTTNNTIDECSKVLRKTGARKVYAYVLARE